MNQYVLEYLRNNSKEFCQAVVRHLELTILTLIIGILIGVSLGTIMWKKKRISSIILNLSSFSRMIPSLVVLALIMPYMGIGFKPALISLIVLALPPIIINTYAGFQKIDATILEAAKGIGMNAKNIFWKIEFPLAMKVGIEGIKIATVEVIASATLASVIGGGGLGDFIITGLNTAQLELLIIGAIPVSILSLLISLIFSIVQKRFFRV